MHRKNHWVLQQNSSSTSRYPGLNHWVARCSSGRKSLVSIEIDFYKSTERRTLCTRKVTEFYRKILHRNPDPPGLNHHISRCTAGKTSLTLIEANFYNSPERRKLCTGKITGFYNKILNRRPDTPGLNHWVARCSSGRKSLVSIEIDFYKSTERRTLCTRKVTEFYRKILHRNPDPPGLNHHISRCTAGKTSLTLIEANFYNSPERRKLCTGKITGFYNKILHRRPDTPGLNHWVARCSSGRKSLASIEIDFYKSTERRTLCTRKVTEFYRKILHRNPDPPGLNHHISRCTAGKTSLTLIEANFYNSPERRKLCTGKITGFYNKILHRRPDTPGLNHWVARCSSGRKSLVSIEIDFYKSTERRTLCTRKVTEFYRKILHRNPDPPGLNHHISRCTAGKTSLTLIEANFYNSPERRKLCTGKITGFYNKILHRRPDTPGLNHWVARCSSGRKSLVSIEIDFYKSTERRTLCTRKVTEFYRKVLHRKPDVSGLNNWVRSCTAGRKSLSFIEAAFYNSKERRDLCKRKITGFYNEILHRAPDPLGLNAHVLSCSVGRKSLSFLKNAFFNSKERRNLCTSKITGFYVKVLHRQPDNKGLNHHVGRCTAGHRTLTLIENDFFNSKERMNLCRAKITGFYQKHLGRKPDLPGLANWVNQCSRRKRSLTDIEKAFLNSKEYSKTLLDYVR